MRSKTTLRNRIAPQALNTARCWHYWRWWPPSATWRPLSAGNLRATHLRLWHAKPERHIPAFGRHSPSKATHAYDLQTPIDALPVFGRLPPAAVNCGCINGAVLAYLAAATPPAVAAPPAHLNLEGLHTAVLMYKSLFPPILSSWLHNLFRSSMASDQRLSQL